MDVAALARELVELYQPEAGNRNISLEYQGDTTASIHGNRQLLAQAVVNLLENAIKYVPEGGKVEAGVHAIGDSLALTVADNGPGIPDADRARILQPFVRLKRDRDQVGSGLGLSLVAAVMRLHRATIELLDNHPGLLVRCVLPVRKERMVGVAR